jgi:choline dehydrogenase-like flavoprotein
VDGLRVADTSVMPAIVGANPNATVVAIAERAAEQILTCGDNGHHAARSATRVSRHGPIPAPHAGPPDWGHRPLAGDGGRVG